MFVSKCIYTITSASVYVYIYKYYVYAVYPNLAIEQGHHLVLVSGDFLAAATGYGTEAIHPDIFRYLAGVPSQAESSRYQCAESSRKKNVAMQFSTAKKEQEQYDFPYQLVKDLKRHVDLPPPATSDWQPFFFPMIFRTFLCFPKNMCCKLQSR